MRARSAENGVSAHSGKGGVNLGGVKNEIE